MHVYQHVPGISMKCEMRGASALAIYMSGGCLCATLYFEFVLGILLNKGVDVSYYWTLIYCIILSSSASSFCIFNSFNLVFSERIKKTSCWKGVF